MGPLLPDSWTDRAGGIESEIRTLYLAFRDSRTPFEAKVVIALTVAYAVSPIDLIPDLIPGLGYLDDLLLLPFGVALARSLVPDAVMADCRTRANAARPAGRFRWAGVAIVGFLWLCLLVLVLSILTP